MNEMNATGKYLKEELAASLTANAQLREELAAALAENAHLKDELIRAQEWHPAKDLGTNMSQKAYAELADDSAPMSELDAIRRVYELCGFDMSCIRLVPTVETFDVNKHQKCRVSGTYSRLPVWASTDWNYIRFDVCDNQWEIVNGELVPYFD